MENTTATVHTMPQATTSAKKTYRISLKNFWILALALFFTNITASTIFGENSTLSSLVQFTTNAIGLYAGVCRMHDYGLSGLWGFVPIMGLSVFFAKGEKEANKYGAVPKGWEIFRKQ